MAKRGLIVESGNVIDVVYVDDQWTMTNQHNWACPGGCEVIFQAGEPGDTYDGTNVIPKPEPPENDEDRLSRMAAVADAAETRLLKETGTTPESIAWRQEKLDKGL